MRDSSTTKQNRSKSRSKSPLVRPLAKKPKKDGHTNQRQHTTNNPVRRQMIQPVIINSPPAAVQSTALQACERSPVILMRYVQLGFVMAVFGGILYVGHAIFDALRLDIQNQGKIEFERQNAGVQNCTDHYVINMCDPSTRVPGIRELCNEWELCMNTPIENKVMTIKNVANLIAQTIDGFIMQLSYITLGFIALLFILFSVYGLPSMVAIVHTEMQQHQNNNQQQNTAPAPILCESSSTSPLVTEVYSSEEDEDERLPRRSPRIKALRESQDQDLIEQRQAIEELLVTQKINQTETAEMQQYLAIKPAQSDSASIRSEPLSD